MPHRWYANFVKALWDGDLDPSDNTKAMLVNGYTFNATHTFAQIQSSEASGSGYTAGGEVITLTVGGTATGTDFDQPQIEWDPVTVTATGLVVYSDGSTKTPMYYLDFGQQRSALAGAFRILAMSPAARTDITPCP